MSTVELLDRLQHRAFLDESLREQFLETMAELMMEK